MARRTALLIVALGVALGVTACGAGEPPSAVDDQGLFTIRPAGARGPLLGYEIRTSRRRFALPAGIASADGRRFFAVANGRVAEYEASSGRLVRTYAGTRGARAAAVSADGRFVVVRRPGVIEVFDTASGRVKDHVRLGSRWEVEGVSSTGTRLALIEHLRRGRYRVRSYDLVRRGPSTAVQPKGPAVEMTGYAGDSLASPDGRWLLTLYVDTKRRVAFVHALDLRTGRPRCIDLPSSGHRPRALERYTLALIPGNDRVYAANPALGVVAVVNLERSTATEEASFAPAPGSGAAVSALSPDGRTLYFGAGSSLFAFEAVDAGVRRLRLFERQLEGVRVSPDGRRVYAVVDGSVVTVGPPAAAGS